ncbi:hypothetical protein DH2020_015477 [Rehmannia glutinosa]|uniref:Uncharacterized protein n=1 Tax=Rehmannia glutinosa TaxID=99300 RepID=A0ABR0WTL0_REHGL
MAKKRKSDATRLDEVDRGMYTAFCSAANNLSQLYSQAMHQQRLSFQAGERHAMEKLNNWILRQQEDGVRVMPGDIVAYVQNEIDHGLEEPPSSPRLPFQQQQTQTPMQSTHSGIPVSSNAFGPATAVQGLRSGNSDQPKTPFSPTLYLVLFAGVSNTITCHKGVSMRIMLCGAMRIITVTKPETLIRQVLMILRWICMPIALLMILLTSILESKNHFFRKGMQIVVIGGGTNKIICKRLEHKELGQAMSVQRAL